MNVAVVGGGYTGCLTALQLLKSSHDVTLYEAGPDIGGVLRDIEDSGDIFFNGCQYLRPQSLSGSGMLKYCQEFPHHYGSLTATGSTAARLYDDVAQPTISGPCSLDPNRPINGSVADRLSALRKGFSEIFEWASSWGDLSKLDWRCSIPMQVSRFHFPDDPNVVSLREVDPRITTLTAIPRGLRLPGVPIETAFLPKGGYNIFFKLIQERLLALGGNLMLNTPIKVTHEKHRLLLRSRGESFRHDLVVWTSNPTQPLKTLCGIKLTTPPVIMKLFFGDLPDYNPQAYPVPYYWQVFCRSSPIARVYLYKIQDKFRFTVEAFADRSDALAREHIEDLPNLLGLGSSMIVRGSISQKRYINFSTDEYNAAEQMTPYLVSLGLIPGGWFCYGREEKVSFVLGHIVGKVREPVVEGACLEDV